MKPTAQPTTTRKFRKATDPGYKGMVSVVANGARGLEPTSRFTLYGGRRGYLWVGSEERGCYAHLPLSVLKRLIASAESP